MTHYLSVIIDFNLDNVLFELQKAKFPTEKWKSLAIGLRLASAIPIIKADESDVVGKLQALISRWVKSTTQPNQWITLVEAIVMCDEPAVARDLATAVGVDYPPHSGTYCQCGTTEIFLNKRVTPKHCMTLTLHLFSLLIVTAVMEGSTKQHARGDQGIIGIPALIIDYYGTILC